MKYMPVSLCIEAFQFDGDLIDSTGKWYIPDWAVILYQQNKLYFHKDEDDDYDTLFLEINNKTYAVNVDDYVVKTQNKYLILPPNVFETLFEEEPQDMYGDDTDEV